MTMCVCGHTIYLEGAIKVIYLLFVWPIYGFFVY